MKKISIFLALSCLTLLSHATASTPTESVSTPSLTPQSDVGALLVRRFEQNSDTITFTFKNVSQSQPLYDVLPTLNIDGKTQKLNITAPLSWHLFPNVPYLWRTPLHSLIPNRLSYLLKPPICRTLLVAPFILKCLNNF